MLAAELNAELGIISLVAVSVAGGIVYFSRALAEAEARFAKSLAALKAEMDAKFVERHEASREQAAQLKELLNRIVNCPTRDELREDIREANESLLRQIDTRFHDRDWRDTRNGRQPTPQRPEK